MSWFQSSTAPVDARNHASPAEVVACFQDQRNVLGRLAFLITGDQATANQSVAQACEITLRGNSPFRDWLLEWAKAATIASAISHGTEAIRICEAAYKNQRCLHAEHLSQGDADERAASLGLILGADTQKLLVELDPLCRALLVLRVAIRSSIQDCALRLNVSRAAALGANCHAMTWLHDGHVKALEENHDASHAV
ncbi:MAG: hypothetical protein ACLPHP_16590 [Candidatus Sulfotelmatobacter sp.]